MLATMLATQIALIESMIIFSYITEILPSRFSQIALCFSLYLSLSCYLLQSFIRFLDLFNLPYFSSSLGSLLCHLLEATEVLTKKMKKTIQLEQSHFLILLIKSLLEQLNFKQLKLKKLQLPVNSQLPKLQELNS